MKRTCESESSSTEEGNLDIDKNTNELKKTCANCGTSKTPLWRGGPAGPKSLCNACGIKNRKKRQAGLCIRTEEKKKRRSNSSNVGKDDERTTKHETVELGREAWMKRSTIEKRWRKLGEEEQAAVLLMALSYGYVYA